MNTTERLTVSPWYRSGKTLDRPLTAKEAIAEAGLDYNVSKRPVYYEAWPGHEKLSIEDRFTTVNDKTGVSLGIVGSRYSVVQNKEAFSFVDSLIGEGQATYEAAGEFGGGRKIYLVCKLPQDLILFRDDIVGKYLIFTNSHDGSSSVETHFTPVRFSCFNALTRAISTKQGEYVRIRHTGNIQGKVSEARRVLGLALDFYADFDVAAHQFAEATLSAAGRSDYFNRVIGLDEKDTKQGEAQVTRLRNVKRQLGELHDAGRGSQISGVRGSVWGAYNAVTEYVDYYKTFKGEGDSRLEKILFGSGADLKSAAFEEALVEVR